jgi:hypothetical protein
MSYLPRLDAATPAGWSDLVDEFDRWESAGRVATLWWRDDDAVTATPQLDELLRLAAGAPLGLAVIPALAQPQLAAALAAAPQVAVLQHGWRHANHAAQGRKSEYPAGRAASDIAAELAAGRARLTELFGEHALPLLVPPWNRIAPEHLPLLARSGIAALSTMAPRCGASPVPRGMAIIDVHVDLIAWKGDRGFVGTKAALTGLVQRLRQARAAGSMRTIGILTHHLIMDRPTTAFIDRLLAIIDSHRAVRWVNIAELLR